MSYQQEIVGVAIFLARHVGQNFTSDLKMPPK